MQQPAQSFINTVCIYQYAPFAVVQRTASIAASKHKHKHVQ